MKIERILKLSIPQAIDMNTWHMLTKRKISIIVPFTEEYLDKYPNKKARRALGTFGKPFTRFIGAMEIITEALIVLN